MAGTFKNSLGLRRSPSSAPVPMIVSVDPSIVTGENCSSGCTVSFHVSTADDYSAVEKITLERSLPGLWIEEDAVVAPLPAPDWTLTCQFDEHFTDGPHVFRAVFHCQDGSKIPSFPAFVSSQRSMPVLISSFAPEISDAGVVLRWTVANGVGLKGFNIYRSSSEGGDFQRINEQLIPVDHGNEYADLTLAGGHTYWYRLGALDDEGEWMSQTLSITVPKGALALYQNHPNPFNPTTIISFTLPERARVTLAIYDVAGKLVKTLVDHRVVEGYREETWDGKDANGNPASSGVYFYRLTTGDRTLTKKMVLVK
jgi:hypothetical protein